MQKKTTPQKGKVEKLNKTTQKVTSKVATRGTKGLLKNGGARKGAGRPKHADKITVKAMKKLLEEHGLTEIDVKVGNTGAVKRQARTLFVFDKLFELAMKGDIKAAKEYLDRLLGKAQQPILFDGTMENNHTVSKEVTEQIAQTWSMFNAAAKKYGK